MGNLEIRIGRTGSGKSAKIAQEIAHAVMEDPLGPPIYWIVPDDVAYTTERMLLQQISSVLRAEVITMQRFAQRIAQTSGMGEYQPINQTGKRLLLASVYRTLRPHLRVLRRDNPSVAFFDAIVDAFDEMAAHQVQLLDLEGAIETAAASLGTRPTHPQWRAGHSLIHKLRDLSMLYVTYSQALYKQKFLDPAHRLTDVLSLLSTYEPLREALVYFDGFIEMTPQMVRFTTEVAKHAKQAVFTLCADREWFTQNEFVAWQHARRSSRTPPLLEALSQLMNQFENAASIFAPQSFRLLDDVLFSCEQIGLPISLQTVQTSFNRFKERPALGFLEAQLYGDHPSAFTQVPQGLYLATADNLLNEVDGVAREIKRVVTRQGQNYGEIVVVVPDTEIYQGVIGDRLMRYHIPFYMDIFPSLASYPLAKFLLAAISIANNQFSLASIISLLKTDFSGLSEEEADWLDTYLTKYEVRGLAAWFEPGDWQFSCAYHGDFYLERSHTEDQKAERLRQRILKYMRPFYEKLAVPVQTPRELAQTIWDLFVEVNAKKKVATWMVNEEGRQNPLEASLHEQAWQLLMNFCNDLTSVTPDTEFATAELLYILENDLSQQSLTTIPVGLNQVLVTDLQRISSWSAKTVFLLGMTDKVLPRKMRARGLLQDEEKIAFEQLFGQFVGHTTVEKQIMERVTAYFACTRASHQLYLSYPFTLADGRETRPSPLLARIRALFPDGSWSHQVWNGTQLLDASGMLEPIVCTAEIALERLIYELQGFHQSAKQSGFSGWNPSQSVSYLPAIVDWFLGEDRRKLQMLASLAGFTHQPFRDPLPVDVVAALYGNPFYANVYQLEAFAACPYKHFVQFGLGIKEDESIFQLSAERGTLVHEVLHKFVAEWMQDIVKWRHLTEEEVTASIRSHFNQVLSSTFAKQRWQREVIRNEQAKEAGMVLERAALVLTQQIRYGQFLPKALELAFGSGEHTLPTFNLPLSGDVILALRGRIDRVDILHVEDKLYFRVMDYKSRVKDLDITHFIHGLRMQLPIYAAVIEHHSRQLFGQTSKAAGLLYLPIWRKADLLMSPLDEKKARIEAMKRMRARGWILGRREIVAAMDERLIRNEDSELFTKVYTKSDEFVKTAPVFALDEWDAMLQFAIQTATQMGIKILAGHIDVSPYKLSSNEMACATCSYQSVCQFDPKFHHGVSRKLPSISRDGFREVVERNKKQSSDEVEIGKGQSEVNEA